MQRLLFKNKFLKLELKILLDIFAFALKNLKTYFSINFSILSLSSMNLNAKKKPIMTKQKIMVPIYKNFAVRYFVTDKKMISKNRVT